MKRSISFPEHGIDRGVVRRNDRIRALILHVTDMYHQRHRQYATRWFCRIRTQGLKTCQAYGAFVLTLLLPKYSRYSYVYSVTYATLPTPSSMFMTCEYPFLQITSYLYRSTDGMSNIINIFQLFWIRGCDPSKNSLLSEPWCMMPHYNGWCLFAMHCYL